MTRDWGEPSGEDTQAFSLKVVEATWQVIALCIEMATLCTGHGRPPWR